MTRKEAFGKIFIYGICLLAFSLPLAPRLLPLMIFLTTLAWIAEGDLNAKLRNLVGTPGLLLLMALYLAYLAGLLYTSNFNYAMKDLETKLSFLLFPLLLSSPSLADRINLKQVMRIFVLGCLAAALTCLVAASFNFGYELYCRENRILLESYPNYPYTNYFFSSYLSAFLHPGYFSMYINLCIAFLLISLLSGKSKHVRRDILSFLFLVIFNLLLLSKIGAIVMALILVISVLYASIKNMNRARTLVFGLAGAAIFAAGIILFPRVMDNFKAMLHSYSKEDLDPSATDGTESRRIAWHTAANLLKENYLAGVGTGDIKDTMLAEYKRTGFINAYNSELNAHNQYMQTCLSIGITGSVLLLLSLLVPFYHSLRRGAMLYIFFLLIVAADFAIESTLETQAGVIFFAFFNSLFCVVLLRKGDRDQAFSKE